MSLTEAQTRKKRIDVMLEKAGWKIGDQTSVVEEFVLERETIQKKDLIRSPFTIIHPQGIRGVFYPKQIEEIIALTQKFAA